MWVSSLEATNFRNYELVGLELSSGPNLLFGENGQGKTNLLEAIHYCSTLESHRVAGYQALIKENTQTSQLAIKAKHSNREVLVGIELNRDRANRHFLAGNPVRKPQELLGWVQSVLFAPEDLDLVRRDPADRRAFMDEVISQLKPRMLGVRQDYERVLKQRNALLKSAKTVKTPDLSTLEIWDEQLVRLGVEIILQRLALVEQLGPLLQSFYQRLANNQDSITLGLISAIGDDDQYSELPKEPAQLSSMFHERLEYLRSKELERGITLVGPHRDELLIQKNGLLAKSHASQGEAWSIALGLKLGYAQLLRDSNSAGDPVLLLDDVFAVLDVGRRTRLLEFVLDFEQVIVSAADRSMAPDIHWSRVFEISGGEAQVAN